ncbi:MAG: tRNA (adenosine(37)-N6)-threonylcarbamoyltransferase complex ATPase subunit type 1 TsaE [Chloroflexi bacterium]|nr:tRNA (adenosine(37)-N6)-threonylcarbamoyltransferase complex ATPase subunit type 1 TsaE [Chloroflexota bacterium]
MNEGAALVITTHSAEETQALGEALGRAAQPGDLILLSGPLGAGKTCLVQGIARGLDVHGPVRSPTFVLATQHPGRLTLFHIDLYRLDSVLEAADLGLDDYIDGGGVCVVEWAEKAFGAFPQEHLLIELQHLGPEDRRITLVPRGDRYAQLAQQAVQQQSTKG